MEVQRAILGSSKVPSRLGPFLNRGDGPSLPPLEPAREIPNIGFNNTYTILGVRCYYSMMGPKPTKAAGFVLN